MKIAVFGTGPVGQALAGKLADLGHEVLVGTRDPEVTLARTEPDYLGNPPFSGWKEAHPGVALTTPPEAAAQAELIVNATNGAGSIAAMSNPEPFTHSTSASAPSRSGTRVFTEVLPPPCNTR